MVTPDRLTIPENTVFEEGSIVVDGDVIVCPGSSISYGLTAKKIIIGEKVKIDGDVVGEEVRIDSWCTIKGNVVSKGEAYIADFTSIEGKLTVFGDLDIGRNVKIKEGFEARGLITIQDPLPTIIFIFFYLLELLRLGKLEEAEQLFEELEDEEIQNPLVIPENTVIDLNRIQTEAGILVEGSRVVGNIKARSAEIKDSEVFGSVRCRAVENDGKSGVVLVRNSKIHGAIEGRVVVVLKGSKVVGQINAEKVYVEENCVVEGNIAGKSGIIVKPRLNVSKILENLEKVPEGSEASSLSRYPPRETPLGERIAREITSNKSAESVKTERKIRKDPFRFERPDKIPSAKEAFKSTKSELNELDTAVKLLRDLEEERKIEGTEGKEELSKSNGKER